MRTILGTALLALGVACGPATPTSPPAQPVAETNLDLQLEMPGAKKSAVFSRAPDCETHWERHDRQACLIGGNLGLPTDRICEGGCTSRRYQFRGDTLHRAMLSRQIADIDGELFEEFARDAETVAASLNRRFGTASRTAHATWADVEKAPQDEKVLIAERRWDAPSVRITWRLSGVAGHHAVALLDVVVEPRAR